MTANLIAALLLIASSVSMAAGDAVRGAKAFQACAACHTTAAGVHLTGPSLANIWGHKAGTVEGFARYSEAITRSNAVWTDDTLDKWLTNADAFIPGTSMTFQGVREAATRQDIVAYLKSVSEGKAPSAGAQRGGGMMGQPSKKDLRKAPPQGQVTGIGHCGDSYVVKTADGKSNKVWEFNLRFKTDASALGPQRGKPV